MTTKKKDNVIQLNERLARLQALSTLASRLSLASRMGQSYDGDRDLYQALGYPLEITYKDYLAKWKRLDIAKAVIDRPVVATWRKGFSVLESDDDEETPFEKSWNELVQRIPVVPKFQRLDRLTGLGRYGVLLLGLDDVVNKGGFRQPVAQGKRQLLYLKPLGEGSAIINSWVKDTSDERYGLPELYDVTFAEPGQGTTSSVSVHHSRVIHIVDELLESEVEGAPRLEAVYNRLMDLEKIVGGSSEMFWRGARPGYAGKVDPDFQMTQDTEDALMEQIDEYEHNLRRILVNQGISLEALDQQLSDPSAFVDVQIQMISAVTGIPKRILTGSERGELASSEDRDNWIEWVEARRETYAEPSIVRAFVGTCIMYGILEPPKEEYSIVWPDLRAKGEKEKADIGKVRAEATKSYISAGPEVTSVVPPAAFYKYFLGLDDDDVSLIEEMQEAELKDEENDLESEPEGDEEE